MSGRRWFAPQLSSARRENGAGRVHVGILSFFTLSLAKDVQGAVFTIQHGPHKSVWVNTVFDSVAGRMQYVALIPEKVVSTVDVRLTAVDPSSTSVEVTYARTALDVAANDEVEALGKRDSESGPEWQQAIEKCLRP